MPIAESSRRRAGWFPDPAKLSRHDPYDYLKGVLERLPTQHAIEVVE
ncbi:transposase domain-containing protein [Pseudomonas gingeri]